MLLKYFYDKALAHASYLVGCQKTGEAIIVDPGRDVEQYLEAAARERMKIAGVAETHIHADYVSGARELADRVGAKLYVSDEGPAEWKYEYANAYDHQLLKDGDTFYAGKVEFKVLATPGHTPESVSFVLTDRGGGANQPMGIFTGDFVFVGSIGRPDLLEEAAGIADTAEPGARDLFRSIERFRELPDYLQVWPAHGAGSACGKGLGAIPSSTVGYETRFNPALQYQNEDEFVQYILDDQPEAPRYFAIMKRVNKEGPEILGGASLPSHLPAERLQEIVSEQMVIDTTRQAQFAVAHVPDTLSIATPMLANWAGSLLDYDQPVYLIAEKGQLPEAVRILRKIGMDRIAGYFDAVEVEAANLRTESIDQQSVQEVAQRLQDGDVELIDVRGAAERKEMRIPGAEAHFLGNLLDEVKTLDPSKAYAFHCRSGARSMIACSIAQRAGLENVVNVDGGITAWELAQLPLERPAEEASLQS